MWAGEEGGSDGAIFLIPGSTKQGSPIMGRFRGAADDAQHRGYLRLSDFESDAAARGGQLVAPRLNPKGAANWIYRAHRY
jgi:hypothetical protein